MKQPIITNTEKDDATLDIAKLLFAILVVAIHTEPFGFSFWLDKGLGVITRLCVPFFFVTSSYLFFKNDKKPLKYVKRISVLYLVWCVLYLPMDFSSIKSLSIAKLMIHYLWTGHGILWYLLGSIIGFLITYLLSRFLKPKVVLIIGIFFLFVGCIKSTYAPLFKILLSVDIPDYIGSRNGLYYGFPYYALGLFIAKKEPSSNYKKARNFIGFGICLFLLIVESAIFTIIVKTNATILWITVLPLTYFLFTALKHINIPLSHNSCLVIRKTSTLIYVIHPFFTRLLCNLNYLMYFVTVLLATSLVCLLIVFLSNKRFFKWLQILS